MEIFDKYYDEHNLEERSQYSGFSKKQFSIIAMWNWERKNYFIKE